MTRAAQVVLVENDPLARDALTNLFADDARIEIVGRATPDTAEELAREVEPDLLVMDLSTPLAGDLDGEARIVEWDPPVAVVVLAGADSTADAPSAPRTVAYLSKGSELPEVLDLVVEIGRAAGERGGTEPPPSDERNPN